MPHATTNGIQTYFEEVGSGEPLVMIHGYTGDLTMWMRIRPDLAAKYRLICYDLRGHGRTDIPEDQAAYTMAAYANDLRDLLTHLGIGSAHICGASMGGMVALEFAFQHPEMVRGLVLSDTSAGPIASELDEQIRAREDEIARSQGFASEHGIEALALQQIEMGRVPAAVRNDGYLRERFLNRMRSLTTHGFVNSGKARRERTDYHDRLAELAMPVLVIAGERDVLAPAARSMHEGIPGSRLCIIPEAGHPAVSDAPKEFVASVLDFLKEVDGET